MTENPIEHSLGIILVLGEGQHIEEEEKYTIADWMEDGVNTKV